MTWFMWWRKIEPEHVPPKRVRVHWTRTDGVEMTTDGFLVGRTDLGEYRLKRAQLVRSALEADDLEGEVLIARERVEFVQVLS